jgi:hypothetical protein
MAVSTDANNIAVLGSDSKIYVPNQTPTITAVRLRSFNAVGNPNFGVDQRTAFSSKTNFVNGAFFADRWQIYKQAATGTLNTAWTAFPFGSCLVASGTNYALIERVAGISVGTVQASPAAGEYVTIATNIEGPSFRPLSQDVHSITVIVACSVTLKFGIVIKDPSGSRTLTKLCNITTANTWTTFQLPNLPVFPTAGTFSLTPGNVGCTTGISLGADTTFTSPANDTWQTGNYTAAAGQDWFLAKPVGTYFYVGFVQHEPGAVCTQLMDLDFDTNLEKCQRYYQKSYDYGVQAGTVSSNGSVSTLVRAGWWPETPVPFRKTMAKVPTVTGYSNNSGASGNVYDVGNADRAINGTFNIGQNGFGGFTTSTTNAADSQYQFHYTADTGW